MTKKTSKRGLKSLLCGCMLLASLASTGCQMQIGGQTLPSPYYLTDDVQYYGAGGEFKLEKEAAQMKRYKAELEAQQAGAGAP